MSEPDFLEQGLRIILQHSQPQKIILFGSRARGQASQDSDYDVFILLPDGSDPRETEMNIRLALMSPDASWDILLCTETEYRKRKSEGWTIIGEIEREGRLMYAA